MWYKDDREFKNSNGYEMSDLYGQEAWYPRVTKILEIKSKPALDAFFKEMESYSSAEEVKNKSAMEGTLMHEAIQHMLVAARQPAEREIPHEVLPGVRAFQEFNADKRIAFHPEFIERRIWSGRHRYAGTVDALASIGGKFGVLDIKTSSGFYPEYNLQTAAYASALGELEVKKALGLSQDIQTRWILRIDQQRICGICKAALREKGGRSKVRPSKVSSRALCPDGEHAWGEREGEVELKEFPYAHKDMKAFIAAKILWEWEHDYWLKKISYL